jgi:DNA processing protein
VYEALGSRSGRGAERIAVEAGVPLPRVRALLPALELAGLAFRCAAGWRRARMPTPRGDT